MKTLISSRRFAPPKLYTCALAALATIANFADAKTVDVTDQNTLLSAAVAEAYSDEDPAIVNIHVDFLTNADGQVILDKSIVINGDADANGTPCDVVANMPGIISTTVAGSNEFNAYITVFAPGRVEINDLQIHPSADGTFNQAGAEREFDRISGIRLQNPTTADTVGSYHLTRVYVSGSNSAGQYQPLDNKLNLYGEPGIMRWGGHNGLRARQAEGKVNDPDGAFADDAAIQIEDLDGAGTFDSVLDHCHAGLSHSAALNLIANTGTHTVLGGVFGHCGRDGIRLGGSNITVEGTPTDRVRVLRNTNIPADNSHCVEVTHSATVLALRYIDVAGLNTANNFNFRGGSVTNLVEFCRGMGKFSDVGTPANQTVYIQNPNTQITAINNCTFHGVGANPSPFTLEPGVITPIAVSNTIFTSENLGTLNLRSPITFTNCAVPTDAVANESLAATPYTTTTAGDPAEPVVTDDHFVMSTSASPLYQETLANYDWSNAQGGDGNADVLRPGNSSAYAMAAEGNTPLTGGASGTEVPVSLSGFSIE